MMTMKASTLSTRGWPRWPATAGLLAGLLLAALPGKAGAIGPRLSPGRRADAIVQGKVVARTTGWDRGRRLMYTYTKVRVTGELKGNVPAYVTIKQPGGVIGRLRLTVSDQPKFATSEVVQVYLTRSDATTYEVVDGPGAKAHLGGPTAKDAGGTETRANAGYRWDGTKWYSSDLPMPYWINTSFNSTERSVLQASFDTWENDPNSSMDYEYQGTTGRSGPSYDGYNVMTKGSTGGSIATTYYWSIGGHVLDIDIIYDYSAWAWSTSGEAGKFDLQNIATHENGHTLVLGDLYDGANTEQTMYGYGAYGETRKRTLNWGDVAGIAAVYPDSGAPPAASNFTATPGDGVVTLAWRNPIASDLAGMLIVRKTGSAPTDRFDGTAIYDSTGVTCVDTGLTNGTTYYYAAYAHDTGDNYASGVNVSATPKLMSALTSVVNRLTITWGQSVQIDSSLAPAHVPTPLVNVQRSGNGTNWATLSSMRWDAALGAYQATVTPTAKTYYRTTWNGDVDHLGAVSTPMLVSVRSRVLTAVSRRYLRYGSSLVVSGFVYPRHDGRIAGFYFDRYLGQGRWQYRAYRSGRLAYNTSTRSRAAVRFRPTRRGTWRARFRFSDADHARATAYSATFRVR